MSANLNITKLKLGQSANPAQNFFISTPTPEDGTLTIERADGTDVMVVDADGKVSFPGNTREWKAVVALIPGQSYTNNTQLEQQIYVRATAAVSSSIGATIDGLEVAYFQIQPNQFGSILFTVPPGKAFIFTTTGGPITQNVAAVLESV